MTHAPADPATDGHAPAAADLPVVRLRPKANARAIRHGFPWVYADELVLDRRTAGLSAGSFARLEDAERAPLGVVTVNPASRIVARMMDADPVARIDRAWLAGRLRRALALRERLFDAPFYRLVHAEADGLPGTIIDRFGDAAVIQPNAAWADRMASDLAAVLAEVTGVATIILNGSGRARALEGLDDRTAVLAGGVAAPVPVPMNGAVYLADLMGGQKTGLFFDQRPNQAFAQRPAPCARRARAGCVQPCRRLWPCGAGGGCGAGHLRGCIGPGARAGAGGRGRDGGGRAPDHAAG